MIYKVNYSILIPFLALILTCNVIAQEAAKAVYTPQEQSEKNLGTIKLIRNIRYGSIPEIATDSTSDRTLDLYLPKAEKIKESLPVIIFIHGGGFAGGDKNSTELCSNLALEGFAVVSINYTLLLRYKKDKEAACSANMAKGLPEGGIFHPLLNEAIAAASGDAVLALSWLKDNAKKYNLNTDKVAISGGSAGAMTALYTAYVADQNFIKIKAVIDFWGGLENASGIKKGAAPLLIYHGDLDDTIKVDYGYALKKRMDEIGSTKTEMHILEGKGHAQYKYIAKNKIKEIAAFLNSNL